MVPIKVFTSKNQDIKIVMVQNNSMKEYLAIAEVTRAVNRINSSRKYEVLVKPQESELLLLSIKNYGAIQVDEKVELQLLYKLSAVD